MTAFDGPRNSLGSGSNPKAKLAVVDICSPKLHRLLNPNEEFMNDGIVVTSLDARTNLIESGVEDRRREVGLFDRWTL